MGELPVTEVDANVRRAGQVGLKEHEVSRTRAADSRLAGVELRIGSAGQVDTKHRKHVLDIARAIEARGRRAAKNVRNAEKTQGAVGDVDGKF